MTYLEAFVLEDLLDGNLRVAFRLVNELGLEDDSEGAVADDLAVGIDEILDVTSLAIGGDDFDDLVGVVDSF